METLGFVPSTTGPSVQTPMGRPLLPYASYNEYLRRKDRERFGNLLVGLGLKTPHFTSGVPTPEMGELRKIALKNFTGWKALTIQSWVLQQRAKGQNFQMPLIGKLLGGQKNV